MTAPQRDDPDRTASPGLGEAQYRAMLGALAEGVVFFDLDGRVQGCNPAAERLLERSLAQMQAMGPADWHRVAPDDRSLVAPELPLQETLRHGRSQRGVVTGDVSPSGQLRWFEINYEPMLERGRVVGAVASFADITEQRHEAAELQRHREHLEDQVRERTQALSLSERFTRAIADNLPARIVYWDRDLRCLFVNRRYCDWSGFEPDQMLGRTMQEIFPAERLRRIEHHVAAVLAGEPQTFERDEFDAAGRPITTQVQFVPDLRGGQVHGYYVFGIDVTERKRASERLQALNDELVIERDRAQAAARAKSVFLANMSHEIRTPMNAIIGLTYLLQRETRDALAQQRLAKVGDAAHHLLGIINDVLDLSKIEAGKLTLEAVDFDLDEVLARSCSLVAGPAHAKGLQLTVNAEALPDTVRGDPTRLSQVLVNLLSNAVKFTEHGSVSLRGALLDADAGGLLARFEVRDTGIGIEPSRIDSLFNAFEQSDSSTTRRFGGTGLGLAVTRELVELMGGRVGVESMPGAGSCFWFTVRLQLAQSEPARRASPLEGLHAWVIHDDLAWRETLGDMLRRLGLRVDEGASLATAIGQIAATDAAGDSADVVLLQWPLADGGGHDAALAAIGGAQRHGAAVLLLAGSGRAPPPDGAGPTWVHATLALPASRSSLHDALIMLLERRPAAVAGTGPPAGSIAAALNGQRFDARVLLAEDNLVNQEVAKELLRLAGCEVEVAENGRRAVEMARHGGYDLVLMDVQMPELDGIEACRQIRALPGFSRLPIIAMTANAFAEDRAACLAAGMNDHVPKPVQPAVLFDTLARWLPPRDAPPSGMMGLDEFEDPTWADLPGLDAKVGLGYFAGRDAAYERALKQFVGHYEGGEAFDPAYTRFDADGRLRLREALHTLVGAAAAIGAQQVHAKAQALGALVRGRASDDTLRAELVGLREALAMLTAGLRSRMPG